MLTQNEIEHSIKNLYSMADDGDVLFNDSKFGKVHVAYKPGKWYMVSMGRFSNIASDLSLNITWAGPLIIMYFQLKGFSAFIHRDTITVNEDSHSLNYLTDFICNFRVHKNCEEEYFCIKINPELLLNQLKDTAQDNPLIKFCERKNPFITLQMPQQMNPLIYQAIYDFINCPYKGSLATAYKDNIVLNLLIHQLAAFTKDETAGGTPETKLSKSDIDLLNDIKRYIDEHFLEVGSLQQLTRKFCINSFKLKYGFKQLFSNPVMKYIDEHKMNHARTLLQQGGVAINDIADELGYQHYNNFSTAFKRKFGYSPAAIRC